MTDGPSNLSPFPPPPPPASAASALPPPPVIAPAVDRSAVALHRVGLGAAAVLILGALLPWVTTDFLGLSKNGIEGDGVLTLIAGAVIVGLGLLKLPAGTTPTTVVSLVLFSISALIGVYDLVDVAGTELVDPGVGLYLTVLAGVAGTIVAALRLTKRASH